MGQGGVVSALQGQLLRFGMVGGFVTALSVIVYYVPATWLGVPPLLANLLAYCVAVALGYVLHSRVSFKGHGSRDKPLERTGRFFIVSLVSLGLNSLFVGILTGPLHGPTWWPVIPMLFVTPLVTFTLNRQWVFG
ncbi:MAG TPA: GtrA family protein [Allosphingosinicella sp.]|nr:GtrA family protein [Allosphingosinicella sp.]